MGLDFIKNKDEIGNGIIGKRLNKSEVGLRALTRHSGIIKVLYENYTLR